MKHCVALFILFLTSVFSMHAQFISEQNAFDTMSIDVNRDGDAGSHEEFFEFINSSNTTLNLKNYVFKDTDLSTANAIIGNDTTVKTYDFAMGSTNLQMAAGQALVITSGQTNSTPFNLNPRDFGGSIVFTKVQSFVKINNLTVPDGSGGTRNRDYDTDKDIGISTANPQDAIVAYNGTNSSATLVAAGPTRGTAPGTPASYYRFGDAAGGTTSNHPSLGGVNASPGLRTDGHSWVMPAPTVMIITGSAGVQVVSTNEWRLNFGAVATGTTRSVTFTLGNSAGLGGILQMTITNTLETNNGFSISGTPLGDSYRFLGGELTTNYGLLGVVNGYNYSDTAVTNLAGLLTITFDAPLTAGWVTNRIDLSGIRDGYSVVNGAAASPFMGTGSGWIEFIAFAEIPEPSAVCLAWVGIALLWICRRARI